MEVCRAQIRHILFLFRICKAYDTVMRSYYLGTPRSTERPDHICTTIQSDGVTQGWGKRVKCRMKCFYETRSHGPQDQDFDVILIGRIYLPGVEPGISRS